MNNEIKKRLRQGEIWKRGFYMLIFLAISGLAKFIISMIVLFQFCTVILTGRTNVQLVRFGQNLSTYVYQINLFLTYNTESYPYPFGAWPDGTPDKNSLEIE